MLAPTSTPRPLALSDSEIAHIMATARPLSPSDRTSFLEHLAAALAALPAAALYAPRGGRRGNASSRTT